MNAYISNTIAANATSTGKDGAIAIIRMSGSESKQIIDKCFESNVKLQKSNETIYGFIKDKNEIIDEVMVSFFKSPHTYTGEDIVEIACHNSNYIIQKILNLLYTLGAEPAQAGEFTMRRYLNGKIDLSQAEAVADLIAADNKATHDIALKQMRGGFSNSLKLLREELINFTALIELELDFSEEDVEFADRKDLENLLTNISNTIDKLIHSFEYGNALKVGIPVVIAGKPNAGKSSLLNALFDEEKAIVSNIAGTTRDSIEDVLVINGIKYRFIDTAGLRVSDDEIETKGVEIAKQKVKNAKILLYLFDKKNTTAEEIVEDINQLWHDNLKIFLIENKVDINGEIENDDYHNKLNLLQKNNQVNCLLPMCTNSDTYISQLKSKLALDFEDIQSSNDFIITNIRHKQALDKASKDIIEIQKGMSAGLSGDLLNLDIRSALYHIGLITGEVDFDKDVLGTVFGKFCIGK